MERATPARSPPPLSGLPGRGPCRARTQEPAAPEEVGAAAEGLRVSRGGSRLQPCPGFPGCGSRPGPRGRSLQGRESRAPTSHPKKWDGARVPLSGAPFAEAGGRPCCCQSPGRGFLELRHLGSAHQRPRGAAKGTRLGSCRPFPALTRVCSCPGLCCAAGAGLAAPLGCAVTPVPSGLSLCFGNGAAAPTRLRW